MIAEIGSQGSPQSLMRSGLYITPRCGRARAIRQLTERLGGSVRVAEPGAIAKSAEPAVWIAGLEELDARTLSELYETQSGMVPGIILADSLLGSDGDAHALSRERLEGAARGPRIDVLPLVTAGSVVLPDRTLLGSLALPEQKRAAVAPVRVC